MNLARVCMILVGVVAASSARAAMDIQHSHRGLRATAALKSEATGVKSQTLNLFLGVIKSTLTITYLPCFVLLLLRVMMLRQDSNFLSPESASDNSGIFDGAFYGEWQGYIHI